MKNNVLKSLLALSIMSIIYSSNFMPTLALRYNDLTNPNNSTLATLDQDFVLGFMMNINEGVNAGFDSDGADSRIFVSFDYGTVGMGMNSLGQPQFTIGGKYTAFTNLDVSLDYVINNLTDILDDEGAGTGVPEANQLRMSLSVTF